MIPSQYRLTLPHPHQHPRKKSSGYAILVVSSHQSPRWAISVAKTVDASAVRRNQLRRRLNFFLYSLRDQLPASAIHLILTRKPPSLDHVKKWLQQALISQS